MGWTVLICKTVNRYKQKCKPEEGLAVHFFSFDVPSFSLATFNYVWTKKKGFYCSPFLLNLTSFMCRVDLSDFCHDCCCELQNTWAVRIYFSHRTCSVAFRWRKGKRWNFLVMWCHIWMHHTWRADSKYHSSYCWSMGQCCQVSGLHLCMKNSSMFLDFIPKTGQTSDGSQHVIKETAINTRPLLAVQILVGLLPFPPPTALSTTSVPSFIQDLNSSQK